MKYVKLYESYGDKLSQAQSELDQLDSLRDFAILTADEYRQQSSAILKKIGEYNRKILKTADSNNQRYSEEWFNEVSSAPSLSWLIELRELPEYKQMIAAGLYPVASNVQLSNRTFVFAKDSNYKAGDQPAIGLFSSINVVRRLTEDRKNQEGRRFPTLDQKLRELDSSLTPLQFFKDGLQWVLDNLDLTSYDFANKKTVASQTARDTEKTQILDKIVTILNDAGFDVDSTSITKLPIDSIRGNITDFRKMANMIIRSSAKGGPIEIPLSPYITYDQLVVNQLSAYPNVAWVVPFQFFVTARNTRAWKIKPSKQSLSRVSITEPLAADDLLRKFEDSGVYVIDMLSYPSGSIDLDDYPRLTVNKKTTAN
jgi:hypothetical protein